MLAELRLVDGAMEVSLYAICDLCAKSFCSYVLLRGSDSQLEWFDRQMEREAEQSRYERELSAAHEQLVKAEQVSVRLRVRVRVRVTLTLNPQPSTLTLNLTPTPTPTPTQELGQRAMLSSDEDTSLMQAP